MSKMGLKSKAEIQHVFAGEVWRLSVDALKKPNVTGTAGHSHPFAGEVSLVRGIVDPGQALFLITGELGPVFTRYSCVLNQIIQKNSNASYPQGHKCLQSLLISTGSSHMS
jgi:hypothetical protein